jgi:hypothetical protein
MFNPMTILAGRLTSIAVPIVVRFIGLSLSKGVVTAVTTSVLPYLARLPLRNVMQIAFFRPITIGTTISSSPTIVGGVLTVLSALPGMNSAFVTANRGALDVLIRLITLLFVVSR